MEKLTTLILAESIAHNGFYSNAPTAVVIKSLVDNSLKSWLTSTQFSISLRKIVEEVVTSSTCVMKVTEAVVDFHNVIVPVAKLIKKNHRQITPVQIKKRRTLPSICGNIGLNESPFDRVK